MHLDKFYPLLDSEPGTEGAGTEAPPTPVQAEIEQPAPETPEPTYRTQEEFDKAFAARLERERTKLRKEVETELETARAEAEKRAQMSVAERLETEKKELEAKLAEAEQRTKQADLKEQLLGKVSNVKAAMKLLDDSHRTEEGAVDLERFFADYPEQKPAEASPSPALNIPGARSTKEQPLSKEQIGEMTAEEFAKRRDEIYAALREGRVK